MAIAVGRAPWGGGHPDNRPTEREIAGAYLRIAHIYRTGRILHLAAEYYGLVVSRFSEQTDLTARARIWWARCLAVTGHPRAARRHLRAVVRDRAARPALRCHAALRLVHLAVRTLGPRYAGETRRLLVRRLREHVSAGRLARWVRTADRIERTLESGQGMVAES